MTKYEDVKRVAAFCLFLEMLDESELEYVAKEMEKTLTKEELVELYNIIDSLEEEVELESFTQEFVADLKKLFN